MPGDRARVPDPLRHCDWKWLPRGSSHGVNQVLKDSKLRISWSVSREEKEDRIKKLTEDIRNLQEQAGKQKNTISNLLNPKESDLRSRIEMVERAAREAISKSTARSSLFLGNSYSALLQQLQFRKRQRSLCVQVQWAGESTPEEQLTPTEPAWLDKHSSQSVSSMIRTGKNKSELWEKDKRIDGEENLLKRSLLSPLQLATALKCPVAKSLSRVGNARCTPYLKPTNFWSK